MKPAVCPVCNGRGNMLSSFYVIGNTGSTSSTLTVVTCRSCNGTGVVWPPYVGGCTVQPLQQSFSTGGWCYFPNESGNK